MTAVGWCTVTVGGPLLPEPCKRLSAAEAAAGRRLPAGTVVDHTPRLVPEPSGRTPWPRQPGQREEHTLELAVAVHTMVRFRAELGAGRRPPSAVQLSGPAVLEAAVHRPCPLVVPRQ